VQKLSGDTPKDKNLKKVVDLCYEMLELADHGDKFRIDDGCGVVFGTLRDVAYKVRRLAEKEISFHNRHRKTIQDKKKDTDSQ
jgi:hypothetical protein